MQRPFPKYGPAKLPKSSGKITYGPRRHSDGKTVKASDPKFRNVIHYDHELGECMPGESVAEASSTVALGQMI